MEQNCDNSRSWWRFCILSMIANAIFMWHLAILIICWFAYILYSLHSQIVATHHLNDLTPHHTPLMRLVGMWNSLSVKHSIWFRFLELHLTSALCSFYFNVRRIEIGQNAARQRAQTGWKSFGWELYKKTLSRVLSPKPVMWLFVDRWKDFVKAWKFHYLVRSSNCLLYSALMMIFRVVCDASLLCIARW